MAIPPSVTIRIEFGGQDSSVGTIESSATSQEAAPAPSEFMIGSEMAQLTHNAGSPPPMTMMFDATSAEHRSAAPVPTLDMTSGLITGFSEIPPTPQTLSMISRSVFESLEPPQPTMDSEALLANGFSDSDTPPVPDIQPDDLKEKGGSKK
jgi:hypothetical protein